MLFADGHPERDMTDAELAGYLEQLVAAWISPDMRRLLIVPPDHSRWHSRAGWITAWLYRRLSPRRVVDILPATGTHHAMTADQCRRMFGEEIPPDLFLTHRWRRDVISLGTMEPQEMQALSANQFAEPVEVAVNRHLLRGNYDLVISVGQVVPHEVIGMANYTKNICVGTGGADMIHKSHFLGAICGMESIMGRVDTPVRQLVDGAFERFVRSHMNVGFVLTVVEDQGNGSLLRGCYAGRDRTAFLAAAALSRQVNIRRFSQPLPRCVVYLDPAEFGSTWLGNKAIYRTRMALADGGELIVLAPGIRCFGEDTQIDRLIRRYGYRGTRETLHALADDEELRANLSAAAHLIHGSSEGRFGIRYCVGPELPAGDVRAVGFEYQAYADATRRWDVASRPDGWYDDAAGEPYYFIGRPARAFGRPTRRFRKVQNNRPRSDNKCDGPSRRPVNSRRASALFHLVSQPLAQHATEILVTGKRHERT